MRRIFIITAAFLFSSHAWAGIYFEPYVGYEMGSLKGSVTVAPATNIPVDEKESGAGYGAKIGYSNSGFAFGIDYMGGSLTGKDQNTPPQDSEWTVQDVGLFAQFALPILLKFNATHFVSSTLEDTNSVTGSGFKIGAGYCFMSMLALNVDMISIKYNDGKISGSTVTNIDADRKTILVSLSLPMTF